MGNIQGMSLQAIFQILQWKLQVLQKNYIEAQPFKAAFMGLLIFWAFYTILKHNGLLSKKSVAGQHAFITGGGMGIGRRMALILAKQNCKITIVDLNMEAAQKVVEEIQKMNKQKVIAIKCDVSNVESVNNAAKEAEEQLGPVDILINNAGIVTGKKLLDNTDKGIEKTFGVNTVSHAYTIRAFLPGMIQRNKGHIVTIASIAGHLGVAGLSDYCGSKFGALGLDESVRMELKLRKSSVKTTCICPYFINTGMFDGISPSFIQRTLCPILQEKYAAERIINGMRQNEDMVIMPYFLYIIVFLKALLPIPIFDKLCAWVGISNTMDTFKGRAGSK